MSIKCKTNHKNKVDEGQLCLACGLCCNGVLFADVRLEARDDPAKLRELGMAISTGGRFKQPCAALDGCHCGIYADRPGYCRKFECLLFKRARTGEVTIGKGLALIKKTRATVAKVERLLEQLESKDTHLPLRKRFQAQVRRMDQENPSPREAKLFGELTLDFHDLSLLLKEEFYP